MAILHSACMGLFLLILLSGILCTTSLVDKPTHMLPETKQNVRATNVSETTTLTSNSDYLEYICNPRKSYRSEIRSRNAFNNKQFARIMDNKYPPGYNFEPTLSQGDYANVVAGRKEIRQRNYLLNNTKKYVNITRYPAFQTRDKNRLCKNYKINSTLPFGTIQVQAPAQERPKSNSMELIEILMFQENAADKGLLLKGTTQPPMMHKENTSAVEVTMTTPIPSSMTSGAGVSPVTLYQNWSSLNRFMILLGLCIVSWGFNGIFITTFFIDESLKRVGNVFMWCLGFSELVSVTVTLTTAFVVLVSQESDETPACHLIQYVVIACYYAFMCYYLLISAEIYTRLHYSQQVASETFSPLRVGVASVLVLIISFSVAAVGTYNQYYFDYCERKHLGNMHYRITVSLLFYCLPCAGTLFFLFISAYNVSTRARHSMYRLTWQYDRDRSEVCLNIKMYVIFLLAWIPYFTIMYEHPYVNNLTFYNCAWLGYARSLLSGILYNIFHRTYRQVFARAVAYAFCKTSLQTRPQRVLQGHFNAVDLRVHILHQAINSNTPQRGALTPRGPTTE